MSAPARHPLYGGVETGGTKVVCLLGRDPGVVLAEERFPTTTPEETIARIVDFFAQHERPEAVGVGAFGPIGVNGGADDWGVLGATPKPGWPGARLGPDLRDRLGLPVILDTDVNAAALGELRWGAAAGCTSACYLTVGTGIGAGLIADGHPLHGLLHPEAGHMRIPHDPVQDPFDGSCPYHGDCWEGLASGSAMQARWGRPGDELPDDHPAWELAAGYIAAGITNIITVASPERFIVGGGVLEHPGLIERVRLRVVELLNGYLHADVLTEAGIDTYLATPALGGRAGSLGAIALAASAG